MQPPSLSAVRGRLVAVGLIALAAAMLLWPLLIAGRPTILADTGAYWWRGRTAIVQGLGLDRGAPAPAAGAPGPWDPQTFATFAGARSATYGVFLFVSQQLGTLWLSVALQALVAAAALYAAWRAAAPRAPAWTYPATVAGLCAATSLPFYASFAMPDVFSGIDLLIMAVLAIYWPRIRRRTRAGLLALLAVSLCFHTADLLVAALSLPVAAAVLWLVDGRRWAALVPVAGLAAAVGAAALGGAVVGAGMQAVTGQAAHNPPFLTARLLADGPGRAYLRRACQVAQPYRLCRFKALPLDSSDAILWGDYPDTGVFIVSSATDRLALEAEQPRFVLAVIAADPLGVAAAAARNFGRQLLSFSVDDPLRDPCQMKQFWRAGASTLAVVVVDPDLCGQGDQVRLSPRLLFALHGAALILALYGLWRLARASRQPQGGGLDDNGRALAAAGLIGAGIVINAAVCGVLSGPFPRYEARLIWLVPAIALIGRCARAPRRG